MVPEATTEAGRPRRLCRFPRGTGGVGGAIIGAARGAREEEERRRPYTVTVAPAGGSDLVFTVENLDGVQGNTGSFVVQTHRSWAPKGAQRFEELTEAAFWDSCRIFRVVPGFVSQFGISGTPKTQAQWERPLTDDPVAQSNVRGTVTFATAGPNTRTTQIFINTKGSGNASLDAQGFSPFGEVISGMDVVDRFYAGYGDAHGPSQGRLKSEGNGYLEKDFPLLTFISKAEFSD